MEMNYNGVILSETNPSSLRQGGMTPLHTAALNGDLQMVDLLLKTHGADPLARTDKVG